MAMPGEPRSSSTGVPVCRSVATAANRVGNLSIGTPAVTESIPAAWCRPRMTTGTTDVGRRKQRSHERLETPGVEWLHDVFAAVVQHRRPHVLSASATASAPAGNRSWPDLSLAARHTASATSASAVTAPTCVSEAKMRCAKG